MAILSHESQKNGQWKEFWKINSLTAQIQKNPVKQLNSYVSNYVCEWWYPFLLLIRNAVSVKCNELVIISRMLVGKCLMSQSYNSFFVTHTHTMRPYVHAMRKAAAAMAATTIRMISEGKIIDHLRVSVFGMCIL